MYSSRRYNKYPRKYRKKRYNIKDIYSPSLYKANYPNYYQQKGRVLQQSPRLMFNAPINMLSSQKLQDMYDTLVKYKFKFPSQPQETQLLQHTFLYPNFELGLLSYQQGTEYTIRLSDLWTNIDQDFTDIFSINQNQITEFIFDMALVSFCFGGDTTRQGSTDDPNTISFNWTTPVQSPYDTTWQFYLTGTASPDVGYGCNSYLNDRILENSDEFGLQSGYKPNGPNDIPFLNEHVNQTMAVYNDLKNSDFSTYDPLILHWECEQTGYNSFTMNKHQITVLVSIAIRYYPE